MTDETDCSRRGIWFLPANLAPSQALVDKRQDTTACDSSPHERVKFFVPSDRKLQVSRCDALDAKILRRVACELQDFGREIFENRRGVHCGFRADTDVVLRTLFQVSVNSANRKLEASLRATSLEDLRFSRGNLANFGLAALRAFRWHNVMCWCKTDTEEESECDMTEMSPRWGPTDVIVELM